MINFLVVTHGEFGAYLVEAAEFILGAQPEGVKTISISPRHPVEEVRRQIERAVSELDGPDGLVVVCDMPGGTPSNVALPLLQGRPKARLVSGANLYMLVGGFARRGELALDELVRRMVEDGRKSVLDLKDLVQARLGEGP